MAKETWAYGRVSSQDQNLDRQIIVFKEYGIDDRHIKCDKTSGKDFNRAEFLSLVGTDEVAPCLREGDELVISSLDRLGRNYAEIKQWWDYITNKLKVNIIVLDMPILSGENSTLDKRFISDLVLQILAYVSERERENIRKRQREGINAAQQKGVKFGRPKKTIPDNFIEVATRWKNGEITAKKAMAELDLSKNLFYEFIKQLGIRKEHNYANDWHSDRQ